MENRRCDPKQYLLFTTIRGIDVVGILLYTSKVNKNRVNICLWIDRRILEGGPFSFFHYDIAQIIYSFSGLIALGIHVIISFGDVTVSKLQKAKRGTVDETLVGTGACRRHSDRLKGDVDRMWPACTTAHNTTPHS